MRIMPHMASGFEGLSGGGGTVMLGLLGVGDSAVRLL